MIRTNGNARYDGDRDQLTVLNYLNFLTQNVNIIIFYVYNNTYNTYNTGFINPLM